MIATKSFIAWEFGESVARRNELHRWFAAGIGRWISEDPIGFAAGDANLYRYVGNSPTNATDPSGLVEAKVEADAFIPPAWVELVPNAVFLKGDNRNVSQTPGASSRIANWVVVELDASKKKKPLVSKAGAISPTTMRLHFDRGHVHGRWFFTATGSHSPDAQATRIGPCKVRVKIWNSGNLPRKFVPIAPKINYSYELILTQNPDGSVSREVVGVKHDGFPAYELYVGAKLIYSHDPRATGEGPWSLWGSGEHEAGR